MGNFVNLLREIVAFFWDAATWLLSIARDLALAAWEWFLQAPLSEKVIVLNIIPAFFATSFSAAKFRIFDSWFPVTNPLSVYLIGICIFMIASSFYRNNVTFALRILLNLYYLGWVVYIHLAAKLTRPDYDVTFAFLLNYPVPVIFIGAAFASRLIFFR